MPLEGSPPPINYRTFIKFKKYSPQEQADIINAANQIFRTDPQNTNKYLNVVEYMGKPIPRSNGGNGIAGDFTGLKMFAKNPNAALDELILGNGVTNVPGVTDAQFADAFVKIKASGGSERVPIMGLKRRKKDYENFWKALDIDPKVGEAIKDELKLVLHHVDDIDSNMYGTLQLITHEAHKAIGNHSGSVKQMEVLFNHIHSLP